MKFLFGRHRPLAGVPYTPPRECEDAKQFFKRMKEIDLAVAQTLNEKHAKQKERVNRGREEPPPLNVADKVWYLRPPTRAQNWSPDGSDQG
jgi:hypothetical protein